MPEIRYQENGDNRLLRHVLVGLWGQQCYWCREFKRYTDLHIDHILPRTADKSMRDRLQSKFRLDARYDVHALYNLAPICGMCNREKGSIDVTEYAVVITHLRKAKKMAPEVAWRVESFNAEFDLANAFLHVVEADLSDTSTRETFETEAPAVVQRLAELGEGKADFYTFRTVAAESGDVVHPITLRLNERARTALTVLEKVAGGRLEDALSAPVSDLSERVGAAAAKAIEDSDEDLANPSAEPGDVEWQEITIDRIQFTGFPPAQLEFGFSGALDAYVPASVARDNAVGDLEFVQGEAIVNSRFTFSFSWAPTDPVGVFDFDQVFLEEWAADAWVEGNRLTLLEYILGLNDTDRS